MKYLILIFSFLALTQFTHAQESTTSQIDYKMPSLFKSILNKFNFSYSMVYLGPSLGSNYKSNATFNRFNTGQDYKGDENDYTSSTQVYHATKLSYKISNNIVLSYGFTFQEDLYKVNYQEKDLDKKYQTKTRSNGLSYNDQRVGLWLGSILNNDFYTFNLGFVYEMPTTEGSISAGKIYAVAIQPNINFKTGITGFTTGLSSEVSRIYYKKEQFDVMCGINTCKYPTKYQTLAISLTPYANYMLSDSLILKTALMFDWDQDGNEVYTNKYNSNLIDVGSIGLGYLATKNITIGSALEFALEDPSVEKTALKFNFNMFI